MDFETLTDTQRFWVGSGVALNYQPSQGTHHANGALVGKVGNYLIDTGSKNGPLDSGTAGSVKNGSMTGTITLPGFEIYTDTLHFLVGE